MALTGDKGFNPYGTIGGWTYSYLLRKLANDLELTDPTTLQKAAAGLGGLLIQRKLGNVETETLPQRTYLRIEGITPFVDVQDDASTDATVLTLEPGDGGGGGGGARHTIVSSDTEFPDEPKLLFEGPSVTITDEPGANRTRVHIDDLKSERTIEGPTGTPQPDGDILQFLGTAVTNVETIGDEDGTIRTIVQLDHGPAGSAHVLYGPTDSDPFGNLPMPQREKLRISAGGDAQVELSDNAADNATNLAITFNAPAPVEGSLTVGDEDHNFPNTQVVRFVGDGFSVTQDTEVEDALAVDVTFTAPPVTGLPQTTDLAVPSKLYTAFSADPTGGTGRRLVASLALLEDNYAAVFVPATDTSYAYELEVFTFSPFGGGYSSVGKFSPPAGVTFGMVQLGSEFIPTSGLSVILFVKPRTGASNSTVQGGTVKVRQYPATAS